MTGTRHGLGTLHQCGKRVETKSQKAFRANSYLLRRYKGKLVVEKDLIQPKAQNTYYPVITLIIIITLKCLHHTNSCFYPSHIILIFLNPLLIIKSSYETFEEIIQNSPKTKVSYLKTFLKFLDRLYFLIVKKNSRNVASK